MSIERFAFGWSRAALVLALAVAVCGTEAHAQRVIPGFPRIDQSDVTGPSVTSGDLAGLFAEPGTVQNVTCPVAWGIRDAEFAAAERLSTAGNGTGVAFTTLETLLTSEAADAEEEAIAAALSQQNTRARAQARRLASVLEGLFHTLDGMDPRAPGTAGPSQMHLAIGRFNEFVRASSVEFLSAPPEEFTTIRTILSELAAGAMENEGREALPEIVDDRGLACAPAVATYTTVAPPERQIEICVLTPPGDFAWVPARVNPTTGDTTVAIDGQRVAFSATQPARGAHAGDAEWRLSQEEIEFGGARYLTYGLYRSVQPEDVRRVGEYEGVPVYILQGEGEPAEYIYIPVSSGCEVQPYRRAEEVRSVRG